MRHIAVIFVFLSLFITAVAPVSAAAPLKSSVSHHSRIDSHRVKRDLREILSAREYNEYLKPKSPSWLTKINRVIGLIFKEIVKFLGNVLKAFLGGLVEGPGTAVAFVFAWLVIGGFIVLAVLVIRRLYMRAGTNAAIRHSSDSNSYDLPSPHPLLGEAKELAESGNYRDAFCCVYLASISYLDEARALRFERSRTNWEYLRELQRGGFDAALNELRPLTLDFDRKIYGRESVSADDYIRALSAYSRISQEVAVR